MIEEKKIKEAAILCADEYIFTNLGLDREETNREIFERGAQWAQQEFIKSLWHDASEKPMVNRLIFAIDKKKGLFLILSLANGTIGQKSSVFIK